MRIFCLALILSTSFTLSLARPAPARGLSVSDEATNSQLIHWRGILTQAATDAKTLTEQSARPGALIAVADAYWELDQSKAKELFRSALDAALAIEAGRDRAVSCVIAATARRDPELAKEMIKRLRTDKSLENNEPGINAAFDLLQTDPKAAEILAIDSASSGPSGDASIFLFNLEKKDLAAADRVYLANLKNVNPDRPNQILMLAGYPFGYGDAFTISLNPVGISYGINGMPEPGLTANPTLAAAFLETASQTLARTIQRSSGASLEQAQSLNGMGYFIAAYLSPQVAQYRPELLGRWLEMQQITAAGISSDIRDQIQTLLGTILAVRERTTKRQAGEPDLTADKLVADADKLPGSCRRDSLYARAAAEFSYDKDFKRALSVVEKIEDLNLRTKVLEMIYFDMSSAAIAKKTATGLGDAMNYAGHVVAHDQRAILFLQIAEFSRVNKDREQAYTLLISAEKEAEHVEDPAIHAALLFTAAYSLTELDPSLIEATRMMREAIHIVNNGKDVKIDQIEVIRRIDFGCDKANPSALISGEAIGSYNLIDTLVKISASNTDTAEMLAGDLAEGLIRVRALAAIASARIKVLLPLVKKQEMKKQVQSK